MNAKDILVFPANTHFVLISERMAYTRSLETIPTIQSGLTESTLGKRPLITIPNQWNLFLCRLLQKMIYYTIRGLPLYEIHLFLSFLYQWLPN
jgi:hypothetical protein